MKQSKVKLVEPSVELKDEFQAMVREYLEIDGTKPDWRFEQALDDYAGYVQKLRDYSLGKNLPEDWIPSSTYWLVDSDSTVLGHSSLRHELTPQLQRYGGHIGYYIRPSQRQKGYGSLILSLSLEKANDLGLKRILITCDDDNAASARIIERHGGVLEDKIMNDGHKVPTRRYWIDL